jgi:hypothetical protein
MERKEGDGLMLSDKRCNRLVTYSSTVVLHHNITGGERQLVVLLDTYNSSSLVLLPPSSGGYMRLRNPISSISTNQDSK